LATEATEELADQQDEVATAETSYESDHTPSNASYSFNPAIASTPGGHVGGHNNRLADGDVTAESSVSSFPTFAASLHPPRGGDLSSIDESSASLPVDLKGKARAIDQSTTSTVASHSSLQVFSNSPSPAKGKVRGQAELREQLLRQKHRQAMSPAKVRNPFRQSTVYTPHGDVVDLSRYSPSSSDATLQLDLSPKTKLKVFSTPQYKLALRSKEEAVAIQMSEARARASDYSTSDDFSAPPTPMTARRRAQQQRDERAALQARFERDQARSAGLPMSDDESDDDGDSNADAFSDESDSFDDSGDDLGGDDTLEASTIDNVNNFSLPPIETDDSQQVYESSDSDSFSGDRSYQDDGEQSIGQPMSSNNLGDMAPPLSGALVSYDDTDDYSNLGGDREPEHTGPTETIFGIRAADKPITQADWERKLTRPLPGRTLPDRPFDSPTPADPAGPKHGSGPSRGRY
jgi:hypothetical protein